MDANLDATLSDVLAANSVLENQESVHNGSEVAEAVDQPDQQQQPTPAPRTKRKNASASGGSSTDARRREANRLAAERSRNRQHEKIIALEMAVQALGDENLKLKAEIEKLEGREGGDGVNVMSSSDQAAATVAEVEAATAAAINAADSQNQQGNLLAALLSSSGGNIDELTATLDPESEQSWMRGVESLFKEEVDVSGRLGELAAVAAGQDGDATSNDQASQDHAQMGDSASEDSRSRGGSVYSASVPALPANTASAVAVAINSEMEKLLRDDIAKTKAAIARVERELARMRGQPVYDDGANDASIPLPETIPKDILEADREALQARSEEIISEIVNAEAEAAALREVVVRMRDAQSDDEQKLAALVSELKDLDMDGGDHDREQVTGVLRALRAHITARMNAPGGDLHGGPLMTPFASSATARRKRGRPPKQNTLPAKYVYSLMYPSPLQSTGTSPDGTGDVPGLPSSGRSARSFPRGRSRLANEIRVDNEAGPSNAVAASQATAHDDYLLSHLTQAAEGGRDAQLPLDSTSFAAFLPPSPHDADVASQPATMEHALSQPTQQPEVGQETNVLSRLRRGPPGSCEVCGRTHTSVWRKLSFHGEDLKVCNACGLYHAKFGILRPHELWGDGKSVKKRKAASRGSMGYDANGKRKRKNEPMTIEHQQLDQQLQAQQLEHQAGPQHQLEHHQLQEPHEATDMDLSVPGTDVGGVDVPGPEGSEHQHEHEHEHPSLGEVGRAVENMFAAAAGGV